MIRIILLFASFCTGTIVSAQNISIDNIKWTSNGFKDLDSNSEVSNSCEFITYGSGRVKWIQDQGKEVVEWTVSKAGGKWTDVKTAGTYQYIFRDGKLNGEITITRSAAGLLIDLILLGGTSDVKLRYVITTVEKL